MRIDAHFSSRQIAFFFETLSNINPLAMAVFEQGVFAFGTYGVAEYVIVGIVVATLLAIIVTSIVLYKTAKSGPEKYRPVTSDVVLRRVDQPATNAPTAQTQTRALKPLPLPPRRSNDQYGDLWQAQRSAPRPLPRVPRQRDDSQSYSVIPSEESTSAESSPPIAGPMGRLPPRPRDQYRPLARSRAQAMQRQYQPFAQ
jgi:hypothetical protein